MESAAEVLPLDDHAIVRGHAVFDTCTLASGCVYRWDSLVGPSPDHLSGWRSIQQTLGSPRTFMNIYIYISIYIYTYIHKKIKTHTHIYIYMYTVYYIYTVYVYKVSYIIYLSGFFPIGATKLDSDSKKMEKYHEFTKSFGSRLTVARQAGHPFGSTHQVSQPGSAQVALRGQRGGMLWDASRYGLWVGDDWGIPKNGEGVSLGRNELYLYIIRFISPSDQPMDVAG